MRRIFTRSWTTVTLAVCLVSSAGMAQSGASLDRYRIGPRDVVRVEVLEDESLNLDRARVDQDGAIELLHVGPVVVSGMTESQARIAVEEALSRYLQRATVSLRILEFRSKPITILGAVHKPGPLEFSGRWTLLEALMEAGGPTENAGATVHVTRRATNGLTDQLTIGLRDLIERGDPLANIPLTANDLVTVSTAADVTVFCIGEFATAGAITFRSTERVTLLAAIARAGGLTNSAANRIVVRRPATGEEIVVSWKKLLANRTPDISLHEGDFVIVKESFF